MSSNHGITIQERATSFSPPVTASAALPVYIGTAPVHLTADPEAAINKPIVVHSYAEAVAALGYSASQNDDGTYTWPLCEAMDAQFRQYGVAPAVFINVFDPAVAPSAATEGTYPVYNGAATIENDLVIPTSIEIDGALLNEDFLIYISGGVITIRIIAGGALDGADTLTVSYKTANLSTVTSGSIIGGVDSLGRRSGIELIDTVFPNARLVPGLLAAPGWDSDIAVAMALVAKARSINSLFKCMAVVDVPDTAGPSYRDIPGWKQTNGLSSEYCILCWPRIVLGGATYHMSTHLCGLMGRTDYANGDVPFHSPSNQGMQMNGMSWLGKEVVIDQPQANYLGENGIITALNWTGGWRAWGNRTCIYPFSADPKDAWIPVRRMFNWVANSLILTYWNRIDLPIRRVLIDDIVTSMNTWFNGLVSQGALLGGRVEFREADNPATALMDGKISFRVYISPPTPAQEIEFVLEYDPDYLSTLWPSAGGGV